MEPGIAQVVSVAADALSLVVLVASAAALLVTARERETRGLRSARRICLLIGGFLVASSWAEALDRREQEGEEAWWGEFERDFERHVSEIERSGS